MEDIHVDPQPVVGTVTVPSNYSISIRGFSDEQAAMKFGHNLSHVINEISRRIDLSALDGVTVAADYRAALLALDRGVEGLRPLGASTAEEDGVIGVAMAPSVLRDGQAKSHLVFSLAAVWGLVEPTDDADGELAISEVIHTIAHECAHVEGNAVFDQCFPGTILQLRKLDAIDSLRWEAINPAWDEYVATRISAGFGANPLPPYVETFVKSLNAAQGAVDDAVTAYRLHGDHDRIVVETVKIIGNLMKFAAYLQGTLDGLEKDITDVAAVKQALVGSWFQTHYSDLRAAFQQLWSRYGKWTSLDEFAPIGDVFMASIESSGIFFQSNPNGSARFSVPFRPSNTPYHPLWAPLGRR